MKKGKRFLKAIVALAGATLLACGVGACLNVNLDESAPQNQIAEYFKFRKNADDASYTVYIFTPEDVPSPLNEDADGLPAPSVIEQVGDTLKIPAEYNGLPVTQIGDYAFAGCEIQSCEIPTSVQVVGAGAFAYCKRLKSVSLPDTVVSVGGLAFYDCDELTGVRMSKNVQSVGAYAFLESEKMQFSETGGARYVGNEENPNAVLISADEQSVEIRLHANTQVLSDGAFEWRGDIQSVTLNDTLSYIGASAFFKCERIESLQIPASVRAIGGHAFYGCKALRFVQLPASLTQASPYLFYGCENLAEIQLPSALKKIGEYAFYGCKNLSTVDISDRVESIGESAFLNCERLQAFQVDEDNAYYADVDGHLYDKNEKSLIRYAVGKTQTQFTVPAGVERIESKAFSGAKALESVCLQAGVRYIGERAFAECSALRQVEIAGGLKEIDDYAFYNCTQLISAYLPAGVEKVGAWAFYYCYRATVYVNEQSVPSGWSESWNPSGCKVEYLAE